MSELLRTREVHEKTGISEDTLRWWRHRGEGPPSFKLGKKYRLFQIKVRTSWLVSR